MLKRVISTFIEPVAFTILFFLTIQRIMWGGAISLEEQPFEKTLPVMILWILVLLLFLWIANSKSSFRKMMTAWKKNWILLLFIIFAICSIFWSLNIYATLYKEIVLIGCSAIAAYTGLTHRNNSLFRGFWWFSAVITILTFLVALLFPPIGTDIGPPYYGAWRGIFMSKNNMGPIMAFGNLVFLFNIPSKGEKLLSRLGNILFYILSAILVFLSKCATAVALLVILNLGFIVAAAWVKWKSHLKMAHYITLTILVIVLLFLVFGNLDVVFGLLNRSSDMTGRLPLFSFLLQNGLENHPVFGTGFGATWESNNFRSIAQNAVGWDFLVLRSDNGYIDIFLHLGLVGITLLISTVLLSLFRVIKFALKEQTLISFFPVFLMIFFVIVNISLSFILELESFAWFLMVFALFSTTSLPPGKQAEP